MIKIFAYGLNQGGANNEVLTPTKKLIWTSMALSWPYAGTPENETCPNWGGSPRIYAGELGFEAERLA
jgi:hypothetical protein